MHNFKQGDILFMNFSPTDGHEQAGYRPAIVVSSDEYNKLTNGLIKVLAITTKNKSFPLHLDLPDGLPVRGQVLIEHERSIDSLASDRKCQYKCKAPDSFMDQLLDIIKLTYKKSH